MRPPSFLRGVLLQVTLELKDLFNQRVTESFSFLVTTAFPTLPRNKGITESRAVPRRLLLHVPLPLECSPQMNQHGQRSMVTKSTAGHWSFIDGAGWRSTGSKSDAEIVNPVSTTFRMLPCLLLSTARPKGVLQFQPIVFGHGVELSFHFPSICPRKASQGSVRQK